jgi:hypothetical protein
MVTESISLLFVLVATESVFFDLDLLIGGSAALFLDVWADDRELLLTTLPLS